MQVAYQPIRSVHSTTFFFFIFWLAFDLNFYAAGPWRCFPGFTILLIFWCAYGALTLNNSTSQNEIQIYMQKEEHNFTLKLCITLHVWLTGHKAVWLQLWGVTISTSGLYGLRSLSLASDVKAVALLFKTVAKHNFSKATVHIFYCVKTLVVELALHLLVTLVMFPALCSLLRLLNLCTGWANVPCKIRCMWLPTYKIITKPEHNVLLENVSLYRRIGRGSCDTKRIFLISSFKKIFVECRYWWV